MNKSILVCAVAGACALILNTVHSAESVKNDSQVEKMTREEFMKLPADVRRAHLTEYANKKYGGIVAKKGSAKGWVKIVNSQKAVSMKDFERPIKEISNAVRVQWKMIEGDAATIENAQSLKAQYEANVAIFVVENGKYPALLTAPEEGWAIVNVSKLAEDRPNAAKLASRVRKECSRAYAFVCGAANVTRSGAVMGPVAGVDQLDMMPGDLLPRDTLVKFKEQLKLFGIEQIVQTSYRKACEQGWAPPPANEFQKNIWKEVNEIPENPIKIKK